MPLRKLGEPLFDEYATGWVDKSSELDVRSFVDRVTQIVQGLHEDGTLSDLSVEFFGHDYSAAAAEFDISTVDQGL
jgi:hypothetical protein